MFFLNLQVSKRKVFQKTILNLKFKFPAKNTSVIGGKFKFQAWDSYLDFFLVIWRFEKQITLSEIKSPIGALMGVITITIFSHSILFSNSVIPHLSQVNSILNSHLFILVTSTLWRRISSPL